ncbi:MAG: hypothetical protein QM755_13305 [Luteolibacter sp.]
MSRPSDDTQNRSEKIPPPEAERVPVLEVEDATAPRVVLPVRRSASGEAPVKAEPGIHIQSRFHAPPEETVDVSPSSRLEIKELGKGVVRLEAEAALAGASRQEQLPVMQPRPKRESAVETATWGRSKRGHSHRWMIMAAAVVVLSIVTGLAIQPLLSAKSDEARSSYYGTIQLADDVVDADDPTVYFSDHPEEIGAQMTSALTAYARARTVDEVVPLIRNGEHLREQLGKHWRPWAVPADWTPGQEARQGYDSVGKLPYGTMSGNLPDFRHYLVHFVRSGAGMLVDWEASIGEGTTDMKGLSDPDRKEAVVRVVVSPEAYYTAAFPEASYQAYRAMRDDADEIAWLYVERNGIPAETLGKMFASGDILGAASKEPVPVRVRLRRGEAAGLANQWLVLDVLHKGWVSP